MNITTSYIKHLSKVLKKGDVPIDHANQMIEALVADNGYDTSQALVQVEMAYTASDEKNLSQLISNWVVGTTGWFTVSQIDHDLILNNEKDRTNRRVILHNLKKGGVIVPHDTRNGVFRKVEHDSEELDWKNADPKNTLPIRFPFELEAYVNFYPGNIAVVAGSKSAGKTAFVNNFIFLNQNSPDLPNPIYLFSSEGSPEEFHKRLSAFNIDLEHWTFKAYSRTSKFADVIVPDHINVIDYLEIIGGEYYLVRDEILAIYNKLGKGFCLLCLQKPPGRDMGLGGYATIEKCRLYLAIDDNKLKIIDAKNYKGVVSPKGWVFKFKLVNGANFIDIERQGEYGSEVI